MKKFLFAILLLIPATAFAQVEGQGVQQTGSVTPLDCAEWTRNGVIQDSGAACGGGSSGLVVGTSSITSGTTNGLLYDNGGVLGNLATGDSGVLITSGAGAPSISTTLPDGIALGTPASGVATNLTGTASGLTAGTVTTNANLTGPITSTGNATAIASGAIAPTKLSGTSTYLYYTDSTGYGGQDSNLTFNDGTDTLTSPNLSATSAAITNSNNGATSDLTLLNANSGIYAQALESLSVSTSVLNFYQSGTNFTPYQLWTTNGGVVEDSGAGGLTLWARNSSGTLCMAAGASNACQFTLGTAGNIVLTGTETMTSLLLNGSSSGTTTLSASATASGTLTLPAATDYLVGRATTDTLTNKSIAGSEINSGTVPLAQIPVLTQTPSLITNTATSTYTTPSTGVDTSTTYHIYLIGGGGGGGGNSTANVKSGGGGGGDVCEIYKTGLAANTAYTIAIGASANGGTAGNAGTNGNNTTFNDGTTTYTAGGGVGGPTASGSAGGAGGTGTNCTVDHAGGAGGGSFSLSGAISAPGGAALGWGAGGATSAAAGQNYGGGGAGGSGSGTQTGGAGAQGAIFIVPMSR